MFFLIFIDDSPPSTGKLTRVVASVYNPVQHHNTIILHLNTGLHDCAQGLCLVCIHRNQ